MALDGAFLYALLGELDGLVGARIDKIYQPSKDEIILSMRSKSANLKLLMSASANAARVHLTTQVVENPQSPPMFCMLLRKHLGGGKLLSITQDGLERILSFEFEAMNDIGDMVHIWLKCEIMGRCSNIILVNSTGKVIDSIKRVDEAMSRERMVLPGMGYTLPPRGERVCLLTASSDELRSAIVAKQGELSKCLISALEGISPIFARECAFYAARGKDVNSDEITEENLVRLLFFLENVKQNLLNGNCKFFVVMDRSNALKDFSFVNISQYGNLMITREFDTAGQLLDYFYSARDAINRMKQRSSDLLRLLVNTSDRIARKLAAQREELLVCAERDSLKVMGDLLSTNIYRLEKGTTSVIVDNYNSENLEQVTIKTDPRLTPAQNAQSYYAAYRKADTAEKKLNELIVAGEEELVYIDSVFDLLTRSGSENELAELKLELSEQGYIRANKLKSKPPKAQPPLEFLSSDGFTILVGRNNKQNDKLTLKTAEKTDIWLHTQNIPGSHTVILCGGAVPPDRTIEEAAILAAYNSKARGSAQIPVDYTFVKYVKKPVNSHPGMVIFTNNKTAYVTPDAEMVAKLKAK